MEAAKNFHSQGNFLAQEIQMRVAHIINRSRTLDCSVKPDHKCVPALISVMFSSHRYNKLSEPLQSRRETLEVWQVLFQFYRDLEEEVVWLREKLASITSIDCGSSLSSTQQLLHKHQVPLSC